MDALCGSACAKCTHFQSCSHFQGVEVHKSQELKGLKEPHTPAHFPAGKMLPAESWVFIPLFCGRHSRAVSATHNLWSEEWKAKEAAMWWEQRSWSKHPGQKHHLWHPLP